MSEFLHGQRLSSDNELLETLLHAIETQDNIGLLRLVQKEHPADVAEALSDLDIDEVAKVFKTLLFGDVTASANVLNELEPVIIANLYPTLTNQEWAWILAELSDDDVVAILELFPEEAHSKLVARMPTRGKAGVLQLMTFPEESAGRIMTAEFLSIDGNKTVAEAVEKIRGTRDLDPTNLFNIFVTKDNKLVGSVTLRMLLLGKKIEKLNAIMHRDVVAVPPTMDQEEVAEVFRKHDDVSMPVLDADGCILGIITVDDVIDVIDDESDEDIYTLIGSSDQELLAGNDISKIIMLRLPWIFASFLGSMLVAYIMTVAERDVFVNAAKLFVFVPLVCAMGGNVGVQSATIMARFLSSNNVDWRDAWTATFKEARVGLGLGVLCGLCVGLFAYIMVGRNMMLTVMAAIICGMTTAATTGTVIPIIMKRLGFDPALATGPFVTSFNDVVATLVYFSIAYYLMF